jgi:F0F1-type ATP synthase assembly protein I
MINMKNNEHNKEKPSSFKEELGDHFSLLTKLGLVMVVSILFFFYVGLQIDRKLNANGIIVIIMTILGIVCGFYYLYKTFQKLLMEDDDKKKT